MSKPKVFGEALYRMVNPKNVKPEVLDVIMNQGYDIDDIMKMTWEQIDKIRKEGENESL